MAAGTVLKPLLMKARQHRFPFRRIQGPRHQPYGGGYRRDIPRSPLSVKRSAGDSERFAGCFNAYNRNQFPNGCHHNCSSAENGRPSSMANFFWTSITISALRR
jgi:hypothetical protein